MNARFDPAFRMQQTSSRTIERSSYRRSRGADPIATVAALLVGMATVAAFTVMNPVFVKKEKRPPTVVRLLDLPVAPPPQEPERPQPKDATTPPPQAPLYAPAPAPEVTLPERPAFTAPAVTLPPQPTAAAPARPPSAPSSGAPENLGDLSARMIAARPPRYPLDSRRLREQGTVVLSVLLATDGRVEELAVARSSGFPRLDRAASDAVRDWRWSPMVRDGAAVMVRGTVTIPFVLQGKPHDRRRGDEPVQLSEAQTGN